MRLVSIARCEPGMILAKPIYHDKGTTLIREGGSLTARMIQRLQQLGISYVYIKDKIMEDITLEETIPFEFRMEAVNKIQDIFSNIQQGFQMGKRITTPQIEVRDFRRVFEGLVKEIKDSQKMLGFLTDIHVKDSYVFAHSLNVAIYTLALAVKKGYDEQQLTEIGIGALLHDVGKMLIPPEILHKPGKLNEEEFTCIQKHSELGFNLLRKEYEISLLSAHCAFQHHEKWDGSGYPRGLKGEEIHPYARLLGVADVFDALTSHRSYRRALLPHEAMEIILGQTHTHFEGEAVELFRKSIAIYPIGVTVKLSTGETGVIIDSNANAPERPIVRVYKDEYGQQLHAFYELDLSMNPAVMITECDAII